MTTSSDGYEDEYSTSRSITEHMLNCLFVVVRFTFNAIKVAIGKGRRVKMTIGSLFVRTDLR